jgi:predicted metal-binding protein
LSGESTPSLSTATALAAAELLGSERFELRVVKRLAACQRKRSISALWRETVLATLAATHAATHAAQHVGLAALLVQVEQARIVKRRPRPLRARSAAARIAAKFDLALQSWSSSA